MKHIDRTADRIVGEHIAGSRNMDEVTEAFWKAFGIKVKPGRYHTGKKGVLDPVISSVEMDIDTNEATRILVWSSIFGTLLKQHFGHIRAGAALETLLDKAPPSYDRIKSNHEELVTNILVPELEYYFGPLSSEQKKQVMGLAKVAFKIADVFTDTKLEPIITGYFDHTYNAPDVEEAIMALLRSKGYDPDQFRQEIVNIMKEYGLEKHIHPDFLKREATSPASPEEPYREILTRLDSLEEKIDELTRKVDELVELLRLLSKEG
ncbi:MAG: hypothetical protein J7L37_03230 [Thermococcus sp.]|nr:hypothetical protein [Thermococcus sp.]